ncbi:glycerol-3-phosphate acyltransferase [Deinococcus misasensis]|uniref:glycerol-3-phosphate acyltransferase n=1 Tax=Deinococcus misasensis TaxID=392413 RepID=UPI0005506472|nr:glycerol-3-phosphate acyltransferase [Deinococcus misasensis]
MSVLICVLAYLIGSLGFGIIYSRFRGEDIRQKDAPGGSGVYRQYGLTAAILVSVLDILKGVLAVGLAQQFAPEVAWLAAGLVVLGHNFPVFFRFDGGGGIAPLLGALLVHAPQTLLVALGLTAVAIPVYKFVLQKHVKFNVLPAISVMVLPVVLVYAYLQQSGFLALLAIVVAMALRIPFSLKP